MMKRLLLLCSLAMLVVFMTPTIASAHVLVMDESKSAGAILHITPDDDPIAGQSATLYFDMQGKRAADTRVTLAIKDDYGAASQVSIEPGEAKGSLITASYIFPKQGVYTITFTVRQDDRTYTFAQSQRVARGVSGSALDRPTYAWAEALTAGCGVGLAVLVIVAFNRRKTIARQSKF
jgi:xanthine/uracil/vitamin C permease (AzgA family)